MPVSFSLVLVVVCCRREWLEVDTSGMVIINSFLDRAFVVSFSAPAYEETYAMKCVMAYRDHSRGRIAESVTTDRPRQFPLQVLSRITGDAFVPQDDKGP